MYKVDETYSTEHISPIQRKLNKQQIINHTTPWYFKTQNSLQNNQNKWTII